MQNITANFMGYKKLLSTFPILYNYREFAPLILRSSIGIVFLLSGFYQLSQKNNWKIINIIVSVTKIIVGAFLLLGMFTQLSAIMGSIISVFNIILGIKNKEGLQSIVYNFLILIISLSLLLTGPGIFAFDILL